jgi:hypothetical protein
MAFTDVAQLQSIKTDITVTRANATYLGQTFLQVWNSGNDMEMAKAYNQIASPVVKLWRPNVTVESLNRALVMSEFIALTVAKQNGWFVLTQGSADTTFPLTRQNFIDIFGGGSVTMANLIVQAQKDATYLEALFSASGGSPGTGNVSTVFGRSVDGSDIGQSRSA